MTGIYVCDLSNNQGSPIDFGAMHRGGYGGVILKASEGTGFSDQTFGARARAAHGAGLTVGAYHFAHPGQPVAAQVSLFEEVVGSAGCPIAFRVADIEVSEGNPETFAQAFCPAANIRLLYSGAYYAHANLSQPIPGVLWWIAAYGTTQPSPPWGTEAGWQFTQTQHVPGVPPPATPPSSTPPPGTPSPEAPCPHPTTLFVRSPLRLAILISDHPGTSSSRVRSTQQSVLGSTAAMPACHRSKGSEPSTP